jgi:hypothetical protein
MDATGNSLQEATNAVFDDARALRLQKKNVRDTTSHSSAATSAKGQFAVQKVATKQIKQNDTPIPQQKSAPSAAPIYTPVLSRQQRDELASIDEGVAPSARTLVRTPVSAKGKKIEAPIQTSDLFQYFSPRAIQEREAHTEQTQRSAIRQHEILKEIKGAHAAPQRLLADTQIPAQIQEAIRKENQLENQLIQADLMQQMASLQRTVLIMNERIIQLQAAPLPSKNTQDPAEVELAAMRHQSKADKHAIRTADKVGSQDSDRSRDGAMLKHVSKTKAGYFPGKFVEEDHDSTPASSSAEPLSSQSSYFQSQQSDTLNVPNPKREYNFRLSTRAGKAVPAHAGSAADNFHNFTSNVPDESSPDALSDQLKEYASEEQCDRCGKFHGYTELLCTDNVDINGDDISPLDITEAKFRMVTKALLKLLPLVPHVEAERQALIDDTMRLQQEKLLFDRDVQHWNEQRKISHERPAIPQELHEIRSSLSQIPPSISVSHQRAPQNTQEIDGDGLSDCHSQRSTRSQDMQQMVAATATQIGVALAQVLGKHHGYETNQLMTNDPPKITNISDSIYLMDTIWPAYQEYVHKGGKKSLWQLYSADQKKTILELFRDPIILIDGDSAITIHRDQQYFDAFKTNEEFLGCLCSEFGFPDVVSAERAFKAIKFVPPASNRINWVNYKSKWDLTLKQTSRNSCLSSKSMVNIFKQGIPDHYFRTCFEQQNHKDWLTAYEWCTIQLTNAKFLEGMNRHTSSHLTEVESKHSSEIEALKKEIAALKGTSQTKVKVEESKPAKQKEIKSASAKFESQGNVNPKWDPDNPRDDNPGKKPCGTCEGLHKYADEFCTSSKIKGTSKDTPRLSPLELQQRKYDRQELGHYCIALTSKPTSIADHHETAAAASATIQATAKVGWKQKEKK